MKTKLEVLYANPHQLCTAERYRSVTPVVRYADACAAIEKLEEELKQAEQLRANAVRRCEEWQKEVERLSSQFVIPYVVEHHGAGRWDGPLKAL